MNYKKYFAGVLPGLLFVFPYSLASECTRFDKKSAPGWKQESFSLKQMLTDLDGDGVKETISRKLVAGGGADSFTLDTKLSRSGTPVSIVFKVKHHDFFVASAVPAFLSRAANAEIRRKIERILFEKICRYFDNSADYLLVTKKIHGKDKWVWYKNKPVMPETYTVLVSKKKAPGFFRKFNIQSAYAWITYRGETHRRTENLRIKLKAFKKLDENGRYRLYGTAHGVVLYDKTRKRHLWFWVFQGGYNLRWPSLKRARLFMKGKKVGVDVDFRRFRL